MNVRKSDNSVEEYSVDKISRGICEAYASVGEECPEGLIESLAKNLYIYENIKTSEIRRQVEECLMSINKKVAKAYITKFEEIDADGKEMRKQQDFISNYIKASNASTGSKYDSNANVEKKNVVTLGQELPKGRNIAYNRYIMHNKIKSLYSKKLADQYIKDLESHVLYKHDESGTLGMPYTYSAKETIEVKYNDRHLFLPFDLLWEVLNEDPVLVNEVDGVWQKYPNNLYVKDRDNTFTHVSVVTKKLRKRDLVRVKTAFGEDVIVTDNHPMIIDKDDVNKTIEAINSEGYKQFKIDEKLDFDGITVIDMSQCPDIQEVSDEYCVNYLNQPFKRFLSVDEELGYLVGFFVGDGNYNIGKNNGSIVFTQKDRNKLVQLNNILFKKLGIIGTIRYKRDKYNCYNLTISNNVVWWLLSYVFKIQDKSENKILPYNLLEYNEDFANGLLGGLIDADGSVNDCQLMVRLSSRAGIIQTTALLRHFGYGVGNIMQNLPFSNNNSYKTNYTIWGVNCSVRHDSIEIRMCDKFKKVRISESSLKYNKDGETTITRVVPICNEDSFLELNNYIYDITTDTRSFALNNILVHNCVAITMYPFLIDGLTKLGGQSKAPTDLKSYCGEFINLVYSVSSQFMGAVATPEFLMYMDYFIRKDYGDDYLNRLGEVVENTTKQRTLEKVIENCFQQTVHSMNMPAGNRGYQTVFWNVSYFDRNYFNGVFGDFVFPDGTKPIWETLSWLQKKFMKWFNEERTKYVLTFPVETMAMLTDGNDIVDKEYADFTAEMYTEGHSFFTYLSDSPDSLSSCCRLKSSLKTEDNEHNSTTHQFSMGTASVATGSKSVMTINLNRLIQDATRKYILENEDFTLSKCEKYNKSYHRNKNILYKYISEELTNITERVHKYQKAFNEIVKDFYEANMLDVYSAGFIDMKKQFLTIGVNGLTDAAEFLDIDTNVNDEYKEFVNLILETINISNKKDKTKECSYNTEFVPGENLSNKNYNWDKKDGYFVSDKHIMYSSYFFNPEDASLSVIEKMTLHGNDYVKYLDGGQACHINLQEHLSFEQNRQLLKIASQLGCSYFTFNIRNTVCNDCGYISKHTLKECPHCGSNNLDYLTRIIGYLKRVSSFNEARQLEEKNRAYV